MSETNDLFTEQPEPQEGEEQPNTPETPGETPADPFVDKLKDIRNESGEQKYKDVETALEALKNSQEFIEQLKREKRELENNYQATKSELEKMGTIDDYVNRLRPNADADQPKQETPKGDGGLSEDRVAQLLEERLAAREKTAQQAANLDRVQSQLREAHGDGAAEFIKQRAKELDTTVEGLKQLASTNPTMALTLLGGSPKKPAAPSQSSVIPPRGQNNENEPPKWERGVAHGGLTNRELVDRWKQMKDYTYKRLNVKE